MDVLPPELLDYILSFVSTSQLQSTTLSLLIALPKSSISLALLWRHLRLTREGQSLAATVSLRESGGALRNAVRSAVVEAWREDPQLMVNLLGSLPNLKSLRMTIGPLFQPEHLEEMLEMPAWKASVEQIYLRFNPYVMERSYYTFLKGAYFDSTPLSLATWLAAGAPNLRRLAFVQDLPPNHGAAVKETPAFGLMSEVADEMGTMTMNPNPRAARTEGKMDFAQPIVFFKLFCLSVLALSPVGANLTSLVLRLPRRNLLTALTAYPLLPPPCPFPSLKILDISTTHLIADTRLPLLLRIHPALQFVILDRVTGLIGSKETEEQYLPTLKWLGKCFGGVGASRSEDVVRAWRRLVKDRPTGVPAPGPPEDTPRLMSTEKKKRAGRSGYANMPRTKAAEKVVETPKVAPLVWASELVPLVKEVLHIPPAPKIKGVGLGLFPLSKKMDGQWRDAFQEGFQEAIDKIGDKIEDAIHRWEVWKAAGKLSDGTRRIVTLRDSIPPNSAWVDWDYEEPDEVFKKFCLDRDLIVIEPAAALEVLASIRASKCVVCFVPDCSGEPGVPHLSLSLISKELVEEREKREKGIWEQEERERGGWWKGDGEHQVGCAHLASRQAWKDGEE
ncbi:hypothetical protein P7C70_g6810, partial [Phenoliferia sp. Uapishka_3]